MERIYKKIKIEGGVVWVPLKKDVDEYLHERFGWVGADYVEEEGKYALKKSANEMDLGGYVKIQEDEEE
tara:strand:+ start:781 stop:987 length:207 start_codon:yes stop_codon:yes gene_type:complete